ncbi:hypothetical protein SPRG_19719 [Saprolegnia parasitica CBS 223.65]|uniref:RING-type domain-containing protein n=1 Tax=Saprolegnia parasitica (strain CBS 223.65) TaxID=695850 RepID=A0A067CTH8_SAPPC|nr:hypothetical protein SPRG_19719 [Saprolegnia parasitica CBS 223.65]KDO29836.1 hypothetical protein SPRG_19719 [Saprolegnia parasitica CBS 223.65]|eukprot:XP_012199538.1 hypothetical protein SPRG_19719 [Saprolegnia parasitica CBS 223.65]
MDKVLRKTEKLYDKVLDGTTRREKCIFKAESYVRDAAKAEHWRRKQRAASDKLQKARDKLGSAFASSAFPPEQATWFAAKYGLVDVVRRATEGVDAPDAKTHNTPFMIACLSGHLECAKVLYARGIELMAVNLAGFTALHCASQHGQYVVVQWLLTLPEMDPHARSLSSLTALDVARRACAVGDKLGCIVKCIRLLEQRLLVYSGWLYESVLDSIANKYILNTVGLNCHTWRLRFVLVLATGHETSTLQFVVYDQRENGVRPSAPESFWIYEKGDPLTLPGTKRTINNREHTFSFHVLQQAHLSEPGALQRVECAAVDAPSLEKWVAFFEECFVQASMHAAQRSASSRSNDSFLPPRVRRQSSSSTELFPAMPPPPYNELFPLPPAPVPRKQLAVDTFDEVDDDRRFVATAPSFCEPQAASAPAYSAPSAPAVHALLPAPSRECVVCYDAPQVGVCVPCGHNAVCMECADRIMAQDAKTCPVCRAEILQIIRLFQC